MKNQKMVELEMIPKMVDHLAAGFTKHVIKSQSNGRFTFNAKHLPSSELNINSPLLAKKADEKFMRDLIRNLKNNGFNRVYCAPSLQSPYVFEMSLQY